MANGYSAALLIFTFFSDDVVFFWLGDAKHVFFLIDDSRQDREFYDVFFHILKSNYKANALS